MIMEILYEDRVRLYLKVFAMLGCKAVERATNPKDLRAKHDGIVQQSPKLDKGN